MSTPATTTAPRRRSRARAVIGVVGTVLVLAAEFALLHVVYDRAAPARRAETVAAITVARLQLPGPAGDARRARAVHAAVGDAVRSAHGQVDTSALRQAERAYDAAPGRATLDRVIVAARGVAERAATHRCALDRQADLIYLALLLTASTGWALWFRRLVSRHRKLERAIAEEQTRAVGDHRLAALVRTSADAIVVLEPDGVVRWASPSVRHVLGLDPAALEGTVGFDLVHEDDRGPVAQALGEIAPGTELAVAVRVYHADGRLIHVEGTATNRTDDPAVGGLVITARDVTERVRLQETLTRQAFHDTLTGLANRALFADRLEAELRSGDVAVLVCDLDDFKNVNDSLGHGTGDRVLIALAERLCSVLPSATVARFGGDEFTVLLSGVDEPAAVTVAEQLLAEFARPVVVDGRSLVLGASIGVAVSPAGPDRGEELLRDADVALYRAKGRGKHGIAVYDTDLRDEALRKLTLHAELQSALDRREVTAHFQPVVDLRARRIVGFEALARWRRPDGSAVSPAEFVPVAESTGLIHQLGRQVLEDACRSAVEFGALTPEPLTMSVNVTVQQITRPDFVEEVLATLAHTGLAPERLTLEITESELVQDLDLVERHLTTLRAHAVRVAIDDFGTGFSSLSYLRDLPVDIIKVDKSFIDRVASDARDAALAEAIIAMSSSLALHIVAEGVERDGQAHWLAATECRHAQGFLWSPAVPTLAARELLLAQAAPAPTPAQLV